VSSIAPASSGLAPGLETEEKYNGIAAPNYYVASVLIGNPGGMLRSGMSGAAKVEVGKTSAAAFGWEIVREFIQRKIW
jgi:hypothetical protein